MTYKLFNLAFQDILKDCKEDICIVTDPPYNIGYKYDVYSDNMPQNDYLGLLASLIENYPTVIINYPETICELSAFTGEVPNEIIQWCYNSPLPRQHRSIAFYNVNVDFNKVTQPYKNPQDKRIKSLIKNGSKGSRCYDWWIIQQVKNVSKEKGIHPCSMPLKVMDNIIKLLPSDYVICDPFMGGGYYRFSKFNE